jgi:signal transduction histidine kinase
VVDPSALLATFGGGIAALVAIAVLRPRRRATALQYDLTAAANVSDNPPQPISSTRDASSSGAPLTPQYFSAPGSVESIVREISHSLNTPLAQIEATILAIDSNTEGQRKTKRDLLDAAQICKSFLAAFREVATVSGDAEAWEPKSLSDSLRAAAKVYGSRAGKKFRLEVNMPDRFPDYDNNYVVAIMLPVLENAIEAVTRDGDVEVIGLPQTNANVISVSNSTSIQFLSEKIYDPEYTTKPMHSGLGLAVVRRLVEARPDASVKHELQDGRVVCMINLPRRRRK